MERPEIEESMKALREALEIYPEDNDSFLEYVLSVSDYALLLEKALELACRNVFDLVKKDCASCPVKCTGNEQEICYVSLTKHFLAQAKEARDETP